MAFLIRSLVFKGVLDGRPAFEYDPPLPALSPSPSAAPLAPAQPTARTFDYKVNQWPGSCGRCEGRVEAGEGRCIKISGMWKTVHLDGGCTPVGEAAPKAAGVGALTIPGGADRLYKGKFTIRDLDEGHLTLKVVPQKPTARLAPGEMLISYLTGSGWKGFAHQKGDAVLIWGAHKSNPRLRQALAALLQDQKAAGLAWSQTSGKCWMCSQDLTDPVSQDAGLGTECIKKVHA